MTRARVMLMAEALVAALAAAAPAAAQSKKMVIAAPGIPPIFASVILYVAEKEGLFKKYGVDAEIRPSDTGAAASRAVIAGDIEMKKTGGIKADRQPVTYDRLTDQSVWRDAKALVDAKPKLH